MHVKCLNCYTEIKSKLTPIFCLKPVKYRPTFKIYSLLLLKDYKLEKLNFKAHYHMPLFVADQDFLNFNKIALDLEDIGNFKMRQ